MRLFWIAGTFLIVALGACGGRPSRPAAGEPESPRVDLQILAFNDFHGHLEPSGDSGGAAWLAAHLRRAEASATHTVIVSAGDLIGASPLVSSLFHDQPTIEAANLWGLDFNAAGNHEFDEGSRELLRMQNGGPHPVDGNATGSPFAGAEFQILAANVIVDATGETLLPAYAVERVDGIPVAFIGLPLEDTPGVVLASGVAGLTFRDEAETINERVREIRAQGVEAIVVLIHQGGYQAEGGEDDCNGFDGPIVDIVAKTDTAVDLFVTGHTHRTYLCRLHGRPVTSAGVAGQFYTVIDTSLDRRTGDMTVRGFDNVPVTHDIAPAPDVAALVSRYRGLVAEISKSVVGTITADFTHAPNAAGASQFGALIADAQLAATRAAPAAAVVSFMNPGGIRADLLFTPGDGEASGAVTFEEISDAQPFGNTLVTMTLTGAQIDTLLEEQWADQARPEILVPSRGFSYVWSRDAPEGQRVDLSSMRLYGQPVEAERRYRVTVNSFLAGGGDGFPVLVRGTERVDGVVDLDALEDYLDAHSPLTPPVSLTRIRVVP